jgi:hypothetical protein
VSKDGGPAFPALHSIDGNWVKEPRPEYAGMSLRDYFAAAVLRSVSITYQFNWTPKRIDGHPDYEAEEVAKYAYRVADAMIKAREQ